MSVVSRSLKMGWNGTKNILNDTGEKLQYYWDQYQNALSDLKSAGLEDDYTTYMQDYGLAKSAQQWGLHMGSSYDDSREWINYITSQTNQLKSYTADAKKRLEERQAELKQERETREAGLVEREAAAKQAQTQARSQGVNRGLASAIGNAPLSGYSAENYQNNYGNLSNLGQSTQNDYLMKMGYADGLQMQADNISRGSALSNVGGFLGGAMGGAQAGMSLLGGR